MLERGGLDFELGVDAQRRESPVLGGMKSRRRRSGDGALVSPDAPPRSTCGCRRRSPSLWGEGVTAVAVLQRHVPPPGTSCCWPHLEGLRTALRFADLLPGGIDIAKSTGGGRPSGGRRPAVTRQGKLTPWRH